MSGHVDPLSLLPPGARVLPSSPVAASPMASLPKGARLLPPDPPSAGRVLGNSLARGAEATAAGLAAPIVGANRLIDNALGSVPGLGFLRSGSANAVRADERGMAQAPAVGFVADTFNPLYLALPEARGATLGETLGRGAIAGGVAGATQPTTSPETALRNTVTGAIAGPALGAVAHGSAALGASLPGQLARKGVRLSTPDILPERWAVNLHKVLGILPGRFADAAQQDRALRDYQTKVVYPWVLAPIGAVVKKDTPAGRDGWRAVRETATAEYDHVLGNREVRLPTTGFLSPEFFRSPQTGQAAAAIYAMGLGNVYRTLSDTAQARVLSVIREQLVRPIASKLSGSFVEARAVKAAQSDLRGQASSMLRSGDEHVREAGRFTARLASGLTDVIADQNPAIAGGLRRADATWHRVALVEDAMPGKAAAKGHDEAIVTPRAILNAMRDGDPSARHGRWIEGTIPDQAMFEGHRRVLGEPSEPGLLGFSIGTGALMGGAALNPVLGAGVGAASVFPFTRSGSALARALAYSPNTTALIARSPAPISAAMGDTQ